MKARKRLMIIFLCFPLVLFAKTEQFQVNAKNSNVSFSIQNLSTITVKGRFYSVTGNILLDPKKPKKAYFEGGVLTSSINTKNNKRDKHLRSSDFFHVEKFPTIYFKTKKIKKKKGQLILIGDFRIKDITKRVKIPIKILGPKKDDWGLSHIGIKGAFEIDRREYGLIWNKVLDTGNFLIGNKVKIELEIEADTKITGLHTRQKPQSFFFKKQQ